MFEKLSNSWDLVKASAHILAADKELLVFPLISAFGTLLVSAVFLLPMIVAKSFDALIIKNMDVFGYLVLFAFYVVQYFVIFFCNTALVGAAMIRINGGDPTVRDGFQIAFSRFSPILGYALIAATVGMILQILSDRSKGISRFVVSLLGLAWNLATFLVVPVLAVENVGPIEAVKRSVFLLKRTWGEQIAGNLGLGAFFGLVTFFVFLAFVPVIVLLAIQTENIVLVAVVAGVLAMVLIAISLIKGALSGIYTAAVYQFTETGKAGNFFTKDQVLNAFRPVTNPSLN